MTETVSTRAKKEGIGIPFDFVLPPFVSCVTGTTPPVESGYPKDSVCPRLQETFVVRVPRGRRWFSGPQTSRLVFGDQCKGALKEGLRETRPGEGSKDGGSSCDPTPRRILPSETQTLQDPLRS